MQEKWTLSLSLKGPTGEHYEVRRDIAAGFAHDIGITGLAKPDIFNCSGFDECIAVMKQRKFRKDLLHEQATHLGILLSERMEDCEGWHGEDRKEKTPRVDKWR